MRRRLILTIALTCGLSLPAHAQTELANRTAVEAVAAFASTSAAAGDPFVWLDLATTTRVSRTVDVVFRPYARRLPGGDWDAMLYQAQVRIQPTPALRIDAGIITSPLGLGTLELRPDLNPVVMYPFYYFAPLPRFDGDANGVQLISGGYPLGAVVSWSGCRWDARGGVTDGTPARLRKMFAEGPEAAAQLVAGGGFSPVTGMRVGAGLAHGRYREIPVPLHDPAPPATMTGQSATLVNVEAEYAVRHTRLTGEWVRDRFETAGAPAVAHGAYVQAVQTLTPRLFAAGRVTRASAPVRTASVLERRARATWEMTAGYRLTPELMLKGGYQASRTYGARDWNHAAVWSLVWGTRWF